MTPAIAHYLDSVRGSLRLEPSDEKEVLSELETHIEDKLQELREAGLSDEEATKTCVEVLGSAETVASQIYGAHTQGTWGKHYWRQCLTCFLLHFLSLVGYRVAAGYCSRLH